MAIRVQIPPCITYYFISYYFSQNMSLLHIFNPSHDEALAANDPYYYPSVAARKLAETWGTLPMIWAEEGDAVLVPSEIPFDVKKNKCAIRYAKGLEARLLARSRQCATVGMGSASASTASQGWSTRAAFAHRCCTRCLSLAQQSPHHG